MPKRRRRDEPVSITIDPVKWEEYNRKVDREAGQVIKKLKEMGLLDDDFPEENPLFKKCPK